MAPTHQSGNRPSLWRTVFTVLGAVLALGAVLLIAIMLLVASILNDPDLNDLFRTMTGPPVVIDFEPLGTPTPAERTNCDEIRGTDYRSEQERQFFLATCIATGATGEAKIEGTWLLWGDPNVTLVTFDASGNVVAYEPREQAPNLTGSGSILGERLTGLKFGYSFDNSLGRRVSASYLGTRVRDEELASLGLPQTLTGVPVYRGSLFSTTRTPITTIAIKR